MANKLLSFFIEGGNTYELKDAQSRSEVSQLKNGNTFSTSEVNTHQKWINGKDIYRKVIDVGYLPNSTIKDVAHGLSSNCRVVNLYGIATINNSYALPLPYVSSLGINDSVALYLTPSNVTVACNSDKHSYYTYVVIEYTKNN